MTPKQIAAYEMALSGEPSLAYKIKYGIAPDKEDSRKRNAFLSAPRQIANIPGEYNTSATAKDAPKLTRAVSEIKAHIASDPNYRGVTYSNYLKHGLVPLAARLQGIPYGMFTGKESDRKKKQIVTDYNTGKIKQLLLSGAGGWTSKESNRCRCWSRTGTNRCWTR